MRHGQNFSEDILTERKKAAIIKALRAGWSFSAACSWQGVRKVIALDDEDIARILDKIASAKKRHANWERKVSGVSSATARRVVALWPVTD